MNPIIGIVSCGFEGSRQFVSDSYIQAVAGYGGIPVVLPCISDTSLYPGYTSICDGFLFCGGDDVTPWLFGEEPLSDRGQTDLATDIFHLSLMEHLLTSRLPVLAICRGMQLLNIARNGTVYQDLSLRPDPSLQHMQHTIHRSDASHKVCFSKNSMLYNILGEYALVNTYHHQSVKLLGDGLKVTGITSDGVIESLEAADLPFAVGVQWHPECMYQTDPSMGALFKEFIKYSSSSKIIQLA